MKLKHLVVSCSSFIVRFDVFLLFLVHRRSTGSLLLCVVLHTQWKSQSKLSLSLLPTWLAVYTIGRSDYERSQSINRNRGNPSTGGIPRTVLLKHLLLFLKLLFNVIDLFVFLL